MHTEMLLIMTKTSFRKESIMMEHVGFCTLSEHSFTLSYALFPATFLSQRANHLLFYIDLKLYTKEKAGASRLLFLLASSFPLLTPSLQLLAFSFPLLAFLFRLLIFGISNKSTLLYIP